MRIVIGGITHESNTFNPLLTRNFRIIRGEELLKYFADAPSSDIESLLASGVEVIPTIQASAFGMGGAVEKDAFLHVKKELLELIKNALIGVVNEPHGTGSRSRVKGITVAGKTGTAQVITLEAEKARRSSPSSTSRVSISRRLKLSNMNSTPLVSNEPPNTPA